VSKEHEDCLGSSSSGGVMIVKKGEKIDVRLFEMREVKFLNALLPAV